ncbi:unnamed protein product, partial [Rotaria magnacalcarata]
GESGLGTDRNAIDDKSKGKARPISTKPISGTPWCIVWTSDQQVFFFNPTSRISLWDRPEELKGNHRIVKSGRTKLSSRLSHELLLH